MILSTGHPSESLRWEFQVRRSRRAEDHLEKANVCWELESETSKHTFLCSRSSGSAQSCIESG
jgi:hypothetical protein